MEGMAGAEGKSSTHTLTEVQFRMEYHKIRMKENEDPRLFFERLAVVEAKFNYKPTEAEKLAQVFIGAENKQSTVLTSVEIAKCGKAKLEDFRVQIKLCRNIAKKTLRIRIRTIALTNSPSHRVMILNVTTAREEAIWPGTVRIQERNQPIRETSRRKAEERDGRVI